jgi:hypothetical protein
MTQTEVCRLLFDAVQLGDILQQRQRL